MTTTKKLLTADDLLAMPDDGKRYELIRGELITMPLISHNPGRIAARFGRRIGNFAEEHDLGQGVGALWHWGYGGRRPGAARVCLPGGRYFRLQAASAIDRRPFSLRPDPALRRTGGPRGQPL